MVIFPENYPDYIHQIQNCDFIKKTLKSCWNETENCPLFWFNKRETLMNSSVPVLWRRVLETIWWICGMLPGIKSGERDLHISLHTLGVWTSAFQMNFLKLVFLKGRRCLLYNNLSSCYGELKRSHWPRNGFEKAKSFANEQWITLDHYWPHLQRFEQICLDCNVWWFDISGQRTGHKAVQIASSG